MSKTSQGTEGVTWRRRKDFRPQEILEAARRLIEEEGTASTSMARIAKQAGVSEATVYKYFENKQDLVNQVLRDWAEPFITRLQNELPHFQGIAAQLTLIAIRFLQSMEETPKLHRVFYQELRWTTDYRGSELHKLNHSFVQNVIEVVENGIRNGEVRPTTDATMLRDMLFGGLEHIALRTSFIGRQIDVEAEAARYVDMILNGVVDRHGTESELSAQISRLESVIDRMERTLPDAS